MIRRVRLATIVVADYEQALDFYVKKLGFEKRHDESFGPDQRWIEVAPPGAETAMVLFKGPQGPSSAGLVFTTDDLEGTYAELKAKGVHFHEPPARQPWGGMQALFDDPFGNRFVLVDRP